VTFIGLVRNPIDTLYSSWRRFGSRPEAEEKHWIRAYSLLRDFVAERPDIVKLVRYEDLVAGKISLASLLGIPERPKAGATESFHARSVQKWRTDPGFRFRPSEALIALAESYGYSRKEVENPHAGMWWHYSVPRAAAWRLFSSIPHRRQEQLKAIVKRAIGHKDSH